MSFKKQNDNDYKIEIKIDRITSLEDVRKFLKRECGDITKIEFKKTSKQDIIVEFANSNSVIKALSLNNPKLNEVALKISRYNGQDNISNFIKREKNEYSDEEEHSQGYDNFMSEYKQYFKYNHKYQKKIQNQKEGDVNIPELLAQANNLYLGNNYDQAISILHQIITHSSDLQEPYQVLSLIYEEKGEIAKALDFLMLAAELSHGESEIWIRCANLNKQIKNLHQAEYCLTRALKVEKYNTYLLYERAVILEELGQLKKAAKIYEKILRTSANPEILIHISQIYEKLNLIDKSIEVLQRHYESLSRKMKVLYRLFDMFIKYEKYLQGFYFYKTIITSSADNNNYQTIGYVKLRYLFCCLELSESNKYTAKVDFDGTIMMQDMIMDKEKFNTEDDISSAELLKGLSDSASIINEITQEFRKICSGIDIENNLELLYKLFDILQRSNKIEQFISIYEILEKILENQEYSELASSWGGVNSGIFQLTPEIYLKIADHYFNLKNYEKAIEFYNKCLKFVRQKSLYNSDEVMVRFRLSEIYKILGNFNAALEVLNSENMPEDTNNAEMIHLKINKQKSSEILREDLTERNPFDMEDNLEREFIKNQIDNDGNDEDVEEEENLNSEGIDYIDRMKRNEDDNFNLPFPINKEFSFKNFKDFKVPKPNYASCNISQYSNNFRKSQYSFSDFKSSYAPTHNSKKNLGKKRIRLTNSHTSFNNNSIENYNFETYLRRRSTVKSFENQSNSTMKNINSLKIEYEELQEEISSHKSLYVKLQESLIYLQTDDEELFLENTFESLKKTIIQELKIEDFKYQLFQNILEKSNIKNFFNVKDTIFTEKNEMHRRLSGVTSYDQDYEEEDEMLNVATKIKDNLFVRKTCSNLILSRKKVSKAMDLVMKQISNFQNIDKFIPSDKFLDIIVSYVSLAYKHKKYQESAAILQLILNYESFNKRHGPALFNMYVYSILNNIKLNNHKIAFIFLKKLMNQYHLKDSSVFWAFLWNIGKMINISYLRSFFYKLSLSDHDGNIYLKTLIGNCYLQTGNWDLSMKNLEGRIQTDTSPDPFLYFALGLNNLYKSMSRNNKHKIRSFLKANDYINDYAYLRAMTNPFETIFNVGRFYQFIGHDTEAFKKYDELAVMLHSGVDENPFCSDEDKELIYLSSVYNYALMLKKGGNDKEAHKLLINNIVI